MRRASVQQDKSSRFSRTSMLTCLNNNIVKLAKNGVDHPGFLRGSDIYYTTVRCYTYPQTRLGDILFVAKQKVSPGNIT